MIFPAGFGALALGLMLGWSNGALGTAILAAAILGIVAVETVRTIHERSSAKRSGRWRRTHRAAHG